MSKKEKAPTKYIPAHFTECDGVDLLSVFLRQGERLFPNFGSNEKRLIYDGDLDYLNDKKEIVKVFRCQIKSVKNVGKTFKVEYKYLAACSNKVSFDPLFFFLVDLNTRDKPNFYYLNLTIFKPDKVAECVKNRINLNVSIKEFTELASPSVLIDDIEKNYLYTLSLSELTMEELRIMMGGITYLNNAINKIPVIRDFLFPDFYSFVVEYAKDTDEGMKEGLISNKHDILSIMPVCVDSSADLIKKYSQKVDKMLFVSRLFNKTDIDEDIFKECLSYILKEAFYHSEFLLPVMPEVVLHELIYAAFNYEWLKLRNPKAQNFYESNSIEITDLLHFELNESNPYKRYFNFALGACNIRNIRNIKKVWKYWQEDYQFGFGEVFNKEIREFFENYPKFANEALKKMLDEDIENFSYYYGYEQVENTRTLRLLLLNRTRYHYLDSTELSRVNNAGLKKNGLFENMNSYAPFFNTIINYCYMAICKKFDCEYREISVDGTRVFVI